MSTPLNISDPTDRYGSTMRVSDAERTAVAERLSQHYADGRLDKVEFDERLDRAMTAKTRADLAGLFAGLPPGTASPIVAVAPATTAVQRRRPAHRAILLVVVVVIAVIIGQAVVLPHVPWLLVALLVLLWLRHRGRSNIRR